MSIINLLFLYYTFFFNDTSHPELYTYRHTLTLHDALPISSRYRRHPDRLDDLLHRARRTSGPARNPDRRLRDRDDACHLHPPGESDPPPRHGPRRSEEHTSELQSLMRISYAVFCLKNKNPTPSY